MHIIEVNDQNPKEEEKKQQLRPRYDMVVQTTKSKRL